MYVYIDVLIITNIYMNFFLLKATAAVTHSRLKNGRCILSAMIGSLLSLIILIPDMTFPVTMAVKIFGAALMIFTAFGYDDKHRFARITAVFFLVCLIFSGAAYAWTMFFKPKYAVVHNGVLYLDLSLLMLVTATITAYMLISLFRFFIDRRSCENDRFSVVICNNGKTAEISGLCDTGNSLIDTFSGKPVIVCGRECISSVIPKQVEEYLSGNAEFVRGIRLVPFCTVNSDGVIPSFQPDAVYIKDDHSKLKAVDAMIGVSTGNIDTAVVNPDIFF